MNKNELQRDKIQVDLLAALEDQISIKIDDVLEYTNPPIAYEENQLITEGRVQQLLGGIGSASIITYQSDTSQVAVLGEDIQVTFDQPYQSITGVQVVSGDITYEGLSKQYQTGGGAINGFLIIGGGSIPTPFRVDFVAQ